MAKPFFFRIESAELLNFATDPDGEGMTLLRFAKELQRGSSDIPFIQGIISETLEFSQKKRDAANKRWSKEKMQTDAVHSGAMPEAVTEAVTVTETKDNLCDRDFLISQHKRIFARPITPTEFGKFGYLMQFDPKKVEKAFTAAKGKKSLQYVITVLENEKPKKPIKEVMI